MDEVCILYYCIDGGDEEEEENEKKKSRRDDEKKKNTIGAKLYHLESTTTATNLNAVTVLVSNGGNIARELDEANGKINCGIPIMIHTYTPIIMFNPK
ncbi:unnamed protein product [Ceratitis capitata]|uniref:(Mediterranean fruit fly) hypothetical protein n=1 Tax=Ceratitis capitata TaxID=7213 RepID=A0A811UAA2_CERCA|nr:unnamed protein product [Ceratitis capitata]